MTEVPDQAVGNVLTVVIRDDAPLIFANDSPSFRSVRLQLTGEQQEALSLRCTGRYGVNPVHESVSKCFIEPGPNPEKGSTDTEGKRVNHHASEALAVLSQFMPTPQEGYARPGGVGLMGADIRQLGRDRDQLAQFVRQLCEACERDVGGLSIATAAREYLVQRGLEANRNHEGKEGS
jgi:hypothetical protein